MPISYSQPTDLQCPQCHTLFCVEMWLIVDAGERPDLAARCRDGSIFVATCPNGHSSALGALLLYHDRTREQLILAVPPECGGARLAVRAEGDIQMRFGPIPVGPKERTWGERKSVVIR